MKIVSEEIRDKEVAIYYHSVFPASRIADRTWSLPPVFVSSRTGLPSIIGLDSFPG